VRGEREGTGGGKVVVCACVRFLSPFVHHESRGFEIRAWTRLPPVGRPSMGGVRCGANCDPRLAHRRSELTRPAIEQNARVRMQLNASTI
jgi:hypothetical protein